MSLKMEKIIAGHQPNYLPYLGFFDKVNQSDVFFILDDAQFSKGDFHNRNRIKTLQGYKWLTIPTSKQRVPINELEVESEIPGTKSHWCDYHFRLIEESYKKAPFFKKFSREVKELYEKAKELQESGNSNLSSNNLIFINYFLNKFQIKTPLILSSELGISTKRNERIIDICKNLEGTIYLSGDGAKEYLEEEIFKENNLKVIYQDYHHPTYSQINGDFMPYMCAFDYLFNCGDKPFSCLSSKGGS